jgi:tricorn protease-like protein
MLLALCASLAGCTRSLDGGDVQEFIDKADNAARKRFAPEICALRGKDFKLHLKFQGYHERAEATELDINRKLFCRQAGSFSLLRQYRLERKSMKIDLAADHKTARVTSDYVETMPYYEPDTMPKTPDVSVIGIEGGDVVFLSTDSDSIQSLISKSEVSLPYD